MVALNEGLPGPRHGEHYYAYINDLDGNKICAFSTQLLKFKYIKK